MVGIDGEAQLGAGRSGQRPEQLVGRLDRLSTSLADEVCVGERGELVGGTAVSQMGMDDYAKALQLLEVPVDGGNVHVRGACANRLREFLRAQVTLGLEEDLEQDPS